MPTDSKKSLDLALAAVGGIALLCCLFALQMSFLDLSPGWRGYLIPASFGCVLGILVGALYLRRGSRQTVPAADDEGANLRSAIEQMAQGVILTDRAGVIEYVNPAFLETTGYERAEAIGQSLRILLVESQAAHGFEELWETVRGGATWHGRLDQLKEDRTTYRADLTISPVRDAAGIATNFVAVLQDVTSDVELERRYRQSERMEAIGKLAGGFAHDFNNQLGGIMGFAQLLAKKLEDPKLKEYAEKVLVSARRSADLTSQLLDFSRWHPIATQPVDIHVVIRELIPKLRATLGENISIREDLSADPSVVPGEPGQLHNALLNIALNAREAMPEGGTLTIGTVVVPKAAMGEQALPAEVTGDRLLCITVSDSGRGMDSATLDRAFEPLFTTKETGKGTGMGLAAVYGVVRRHGGGIRLTSQPGRGTTAHLYLPLTTAEPRERSRPVRPVAVAADPAPDLTPACVLVVDDEEATRNVAEALLKKLGHVVVTKKSGEDGLEWFRDHAAEVDLIILDLVMPGLGGGETFTALREVKPDAQILLISGYNPGEDSEAALDAGAIGFLQKPFGLDELSAAIGPALNRRQPAL